MLVEGRPPKSLIPPRCVLICVLMGPRMTRQWYAMEPHAIFSRNFVVPSDFFLI